MGLRVCSWPETRIKEMKDRERAIVTALTIVMLVLWLGFVFHKSPRFAGSFWGGVLGVGFGVIRDILTLAGTITSTFLLIDRLSNDR